MLVHGHSGSWTNWLANISHFAASHRVIAPDLPGFGRSEMPRERISIEGYARFLAKVLDALGVASAPVVGNSMGGFVGAELAVKDRDRVEGLALVSAAGLSTKYIGLSAELLRPGDPPRAEGHPPRHRPCPHDRATRGVQPADRRVPGRAGARGRRGGGLAHPVTAPAEALDTSFAYLAIAPVS